MNNKPLEPGDLLAYLDGVALPHVEQALEASAEVRQEFAQLRRTVQHLHERLEGLSVPEPQDLVDVATGQATPQQQLRVAAYVRANPRAKATFTELLALQSQPADRPVRFRLPRFVALPQLLGAGMRSIAPVVPDQSFYASELAVQIVLRLPPPENDYWRIEGYVTHHDQPAPDVRVRLRGDQARPRPRTTDADGFFTFARLAAGTYLVQVHFAEGVVLLPPLTLSHA
ncbi:carboxypeptidase-like regulatory domain-containing protein [Candidatus Chloroploca sp. Khr17]|uniref:carboxypeptidase-like regulatory domain-containing protein n=1 Tax=Candidatus Chloroploca sp. Khr17 TaxID=2496869 RepID=UPI00101C743E|nr:carboxypeptidase-like regulatory domain-containing protein [Candidatus Chloroploca sp. Khr17]